ncbi:uncharacterized protein GJ701_000835 [Geothlypis trichas]
MCCKFTFCRLHTSGGSHPCGKKIQVLMHVSNFIEVWSPSQVKREFSGKHFPHGSNKGLKPELPGMQLGFACFSNTFIVSVIFSGHCGPRSVTRDAAELAYNQA